MKVKQSLGALIINATNLMGLAIITTIILFMNGLLPNLIKMPFLIILLVVLLNILLKVIKYQTSYLEVYEHYIVKKTGLIFKKQQSYLVKELVAVNIYAYPLLRISKAVKIDIESNDYLLEDIEYLIKKENALLIKNHFNKINNNLGIKEDQLKDTYKISAFNLFKHSISHTNLFANLIVLGLIITFIFVVYMQNIILFTGQDFISSFIKTILDVISIYGLVALIIITYTIIKYIITLIKYYGFQIEDYHQYLIISYGLNNRLHYRINKNDINGIIYHQNMFDLILRNYRIDLLVSGYKALDEDFEDDGSYSDRSILAIAITNKQAIDLLGLMLPQYQTYNDKNALRNTNAFIKIILLPLVVISSITLITCLALSIFIFFGIAFISLTLFILVIAYLLFVSNQSFWFDEEYLYASSFNLKRLKKKKIMVLKDKILALRYSNSHLLINSYSNLPSNAHLDLYFVSEDLYQKLKKSI
ncbi:MAG: hypothetical protein ACRCTA_06830 [Bacilli bacterium]